MKWSRGRIELDLTMAPRRSRRAKASPAKVPLARQSGRADGSEAESSGRRDLDWLKSYDRTRAS